jgi:fatty-acyl-CoA synthase
MNEKSICYITLPLYHGNALAVAFSAVITAGASALLRKKFSVTHFFEDVNHYGVTHMVYIGELWRYLLNRYQDNPNKSLHTIFGNGLTKELWEEVTKRYKIEHVVEHFGATEMPAAALTNWYDKAGYCGYIPPSTPEHDDVIMIDEEGKEVGVGEVGEAIFRVPKNHYRGYLDPSLDKPKTLERDGHLWWRSGDLLKRNSDGFFTFVDRAGDSYRFKGENVSSVDVETVLMASGYCMEAVVYGIQFPHIDGKIGMASLVLKKPLDEGFYDYVKAHLAPYALPYFLKIAKDLHKTTATLKIQKSHLAREGIEGYHDRPHFVLHKGKYQPIDKPIYEALKNGEITLGKAS